MATTNGVLERGRQRMRRGGGFEPQDRALLLAAGQAPGFDPDTNPVDRDIERFLNGSWGHPWREKIKPRASVWTPDEARAIAAAEAIMAEKRRLYEAAIDARFAAERLYYNPPGRTTTEQLVQLSQRHREAVETQRKTTEQLEVALAQVTTLKMQAQYRRQWEATRKLIPSADNDAARVESDGRPSHRP